MSEDTPYEAPDDADEIAELKARIAELGDPAEFLAHLIAAAKGKLGPAGEFSDGKLGPDDEGDLRMGVRASPEGLVHFNFGTPVAWFALPAQLAADFASLILKTARDAAKAQGAKLIFDMPIGGMTITSTLAEPPEEETRQ